MKVLTIAAVVLCIAGSVNAGLHLAVEGDIAEDQYSVSAEQVVNMGIFATAGQTATSGVFIHWEGPGTIDYIDINNWVYPDAIIGPPVCPDIYPPPYNCNFLFIDLAVPQNPPPVIDGLVVTDIMLTYHGPEDVVITMLDGDTFDVMDAVTFVPEPMTIVLLGFGVVLMRRR